MTTTAVLPPEYKKDYERGWRAGASGSMTALERADGRNEPSAWYDGYLDYATGREKWHLPFCPHHDSCP